MASCFKDWPIYHLPKQKFGFAVLITVYTIFMSSPNNNVLQMVLETTPVGLEEQEVTVPRHWQLPAPRPHHLCQTHG